MPIYVPIEDFHFKVSSNFMAHFARSSARISNRDKCKYVFRRMENLEVPEQRATGLSKEIRMNLTLSTKGNEV